MIVDINVGVPRTNLSEDEINSLTQTVSYPTSHGWVPGTWVLDTDGKLQMYNTKCHRVYEKIDILVKN